MKIARMLFPVNNLGPGNRVVIWMAGCKRQCVGCANPELQDATGIKDISIGILRNAILQFVKSAGCNVEGFTITGGEPFEQPEALMEIIEMCHEYCNDILVFSGNVRAELAKYEDDIVSNISVLIDGPYIEAQNNGHPLKGSDNQVVHFIDESVREKYQKYFSQMNGKNYIECFSTQDGVVVTGIHKPDFKKEYKKHVKEARHKEKEHE
ncbi:MAG: radical SAM protein [Lachnospiraceae bacterium]|nr:radical SAM protein [Lachnospiraceae bacterium]